MCGAGPLKKRKMPWFEFEISLVSVVLVLGSCVAFWITREKEGQVKLPTYSGDLDTRHFGESDPFDVTKPEDVMDGYPLNGEGFWQRVSLQAC